LYWISATQEVVIEKHGGKSGTDDASVVLTVVFWQNSVEVFSPDNVVILPRGGESPIGDDDSLRQFGFKLETQDIAGIVGTKRNNTAFKISPDLADSQRFTTGHPVSRKIF
jgi:hypothetical protein